ncbi:MULTISPECIES: hypothetical protein [Lysobacter]|uniref:hypothetical protein n=1 Tax=Lysobacteraceae TaxID=32033 RepID=UPI001CD08092|nr:MULTISPECIES: hypothetical protein [Lysobacter]
MSTVRYTRKTAPRDWIRTDEWDPISTEGLDDTEMARIAILTEAINLYVSGGPISNYLKDSSVSRTSFLRAFNRCLCFDGEGRQLGWRGLLPRLRVKAPVRTKSLIPSGRNGQGGLSGALQLFFRRNEDVKEALDKYMLNSAKRASGHENKLRHRSAHKKFISLCRSKGVAEFEWPFNTKTKAKGAINAYVKRFIHARYDDIVATQFGDRAKAKSKTGTGYASRLTAVRPFDVVELDEHKCHFIGSIGIPAGDITRWLPVQRVTIVLCADRSSSVILGYLPILRREANSEDILATINAALGKREKYVFSEGMEYTPHGGFPGDLGGPFSWCGFNQLLVDNALSHIANSVVDRVCDIAGCDLNFGPVRRFDRRPVVERIFGEIERAGFHRVASTTGSNPFDPLRQDPEGAATKAQVRLADLLDLIEAVVADHNGKVGKRNHGARPLERLQSLVNDDDGLGMIFPVLPPLLPGVAGLELSIVPCFVRGSREKGRRPQIYFEEEEYFGKNLADRWDLLDKQVFAHVDRNDIRQFDVFHNGVKVDTVVVRGRWRHSPHSRDTRRHINSDLRSGYLEVGFDEDPVNAHNAALSKRLTRVKGVDAKGVVGAANAFAEEQRVRAQSAPKTASDCLQDAIDQLNEPDLPSSNEDELWNMEDLGAFNRGEQ